MENVVTQGSQELSPIFLPGDNSAFRTPVFTVMLEKDHVSWSNKNRLHLHPFSFLDSPATFLALFDSFKFHLGFFQFSPVQIIAWVLHSHISVSTPRGSWYCLLLRPYLLGTTEMHVASYSSSEASSTPSWQLWARFLLTGYSPSPGIGCPLRPLLFTLTSNCQDNSFDEPRKSKTYSSARAMV